MSGDFSLLHYPAVPNEQGQALLVMLPGAGIEASAFAANGLVAAVHARGLPVDIIAARPRLELYLSGDIAAALHRAVLEPALAQGYARLWLLGISLGGMAALLTASLRIAELEGIILLAPYLGTQGTIAALEAACSLASATALEQRIWAWLRQDPARPAVYLGYGEADRFARGHRLLARALPARNVVTQPGGHDWATWTALWQRLLDTEPFGASP